MEGRSGECSAGIEWLVVANAHDTVLCFSSRGRCYWLKVYEVPEGTRNSRGKPIVNLFPLIEGEKITAVLPIKEFDEEHFVFMATSEGTVKKTALSAFSNPRKAGIIAVDLDDAIVRTIYDYVGARYAVSDLFEETVDVIDRAGLKPHVRDNVERDLVYAF